MQLLGYLFVGHFLIVAHLDDLTVAGRQLLHHLPDDHDSLLANEGLLGVVVVGGQGVFVGLVVAGDRHGVERHGLEVLPAEEVEPAVAGYGEEPGGEAVVGGEGVELAEGFAEGFDGEVVGIGGVVGHAEQHEVDGFAIIAHQVGIGALVAFFAGGKD